MDTYSLQKFLRSPIPVKFLPYALLLFSFLGFLDATYLTILHYKNAFPPCTIGGCETVLTSQYATFFGLPLSLWGAGFYVVMMILAGILLSIKSSRFARTITTALFVLSGFGLLVGLFLVYLQIFVLHALCYYCLFSEVIDFLIFDTAWWMYNSPSVETSH